MSKLPQQHIIDQLHLDGLPVPNLLTQKDLEVVLEEMGFSIPFEPKYHNLVTGVRGRFGDFNVTPFAVSDGDDDVVCFVISEGRRRGHIVQFKDHSSRGQEFPMYYNTLSDWLSGNRDDPLT